MIASRALAILTSHYMPNAMYRTVVYHCILVDILS